MKVFTNNSSNISHWNRDNSDFLRNALLYDFQLKEEEAKQHQRVVEDAGVSPGVLQQLHALYHLVLLLFKQLRRHREFFFFQQQLPLLGFQVLLVFLDDIAGFTDLALFRCGLGESHIHIFVFQSLRLSCFTCHQSHLFFQHCNSLMLLCFYVLKRGPLGL